MKQGVPICESVKRSILRMWRSGISRRDTAKRLGISKTTVQKFVREYIASLGQDEPEEKTETE